MDVSKKMRHLRGLIAELRLKICHKLVILSKVFS